MKNKLKNKIKDVLFSSSSAFIQRFRFRYDKKKRGFSSKLIKFVKSNY